MLVCLFYAVMFVFIIQNEGIKIYSLDALFGLPRKKSAGNSYRPPLHGHLSFIDQAEVDEYVASSHSNHKERQQVSLLLLLFTFHFRTAEFYAFFIRNVIIFWLEICFEVQAGIMLWMKLLCLGLHVAMRFLLLFLI